LYKVPNWKYNGNKIEIDSASLREINRKYDGNRVEIDSASLREINRKYDGNRVEIDFAALACGRQAQRNSSQFFAPWRLCALFSFSFFLAKRACGRQDTFLMSNAERRLKNKEVKKHGVMPVADLLALQYLV
jgi:hypothetical protein